MCEKSLIKYITETFFFNSAYIYVYTYPCHAHTPRVVYDAIMIVEFYLPFCFGIYKNNNAYNDNIRVRI